MNCKDGKKVNNMRLIDADMLKRQYEEHKRLFCRNRIEFSTLSDKDKARVDELDNCIAEILNAPTIEPERKTGKWVGAIEYCKHLEEKTGERYQPSGLAGMIYCNQCWRASDRRSNYCRECGSVMTEGGDTP
jgi:hypothetical protein